MLFQTFLFYGKFHQLVQELLFNNFYSFYYIINHLYIIAFEMENGTFKTIYYMYTNLVTNTFCALLTCQTVLLPFLHFFFFSNRSLRAINTKLYFLREFVHLYVYNELVYVVDLLICANKCMT